MYPDNTLPADSQLLSLPNLKKAGLDGLTYSVCYTGTFP